MMLDAFLSMLVAERAASPHTCEAYRRDLEQAALYLKKRNKNLAMADGPTLEHFFKSLAVLAPRSRARKLSSLRQYYRFLISENARSDDPTAGLDTPKLGRTLPGVISIEEMEALLKAVSGQTPEAKRLLALMELAYGSGLRVSELVALPYAAYSPARPAMLVRGKGNKERLVPLSAPAHTAVQNYVAVRTHFLAKNKKQSPYLFPSRGGKGHLTRIRFYQLLKDAALAAGLAPEKIHPHALRHAFATHVLAGGADLRSLQHMLGHTDIATTQIYTHMVDGHLQKTLATHHPLAQKRLRK